MEAEMTFRTAEKITVREEEDDCFTLYHDEQAFETNAVGVEIITICREPHTLSSLCEELSTRFDVEPEILRDDVNALIPDLIACNLIEVI